MRNSANKHTQMIMLMLAVMLFSLTRPAIAEDSIEKAWITKLVEIKEADPQFEITCKFPEFKEIDKSNFKALNKKLESLVKERIIESKNNFSKREDKGKTGSYLVMNYNVFRANKSLISIIFNIESYSAGAAHPVHWTEAVNYDLSKDRPLRLPYILINSNNYLKKLSQLCIADLKQQKKLKDQYWIEEGAGPKAKNFTSFYLDKTGIGIIFDEYKVGPYVAGAHSVHIPYTSLKDDLNIDLDLAK